MPTRRQKQRAYRGWTWEDITPTPSPSSKSSSSSKQIPISRQHFVRRRRTSVPALIGRAHTMGGKRRRQRKGERTRRR